jgi:BASS family bile acid:Na+ symporter
MPFALTVCSTIGILVVIITLIYGGITNSHIFSSGWKIYFAVVVVGLVGFGFGYLFATIFRAGRRDSRTIALETGESF